MDLNHRRPALQAGALPTELWMHGALGRIRTHIAKLRRLAVIQLTYKRILKLVPPEGFEPSLRPNLGLTGV